MYAQILPLVVKTIAGDREAFEQLLHSQKPLIRYIIRRKTDCPEDAEDILQEVSLRIFMHITSLRCPEAFISWMKAIIVHECLRHFASNRHCVSINTIAEYENLCVETDPDCNPFACFERLELYDALHSALEKLQEPLRKMFYMRYKKGMCCSDIAASIGLKTGTVSVKMFRAKKQLRKMLRCGVVNA